MVIALALLAQVGTCGPARRGRERAFPQPGAASLAAIATLLSRRSQSPRLRNRWLQTLAMVHLCAQVTQMVIALALLAQAGTCGPARRGREQALPQPGAASLAAIAPLLSRRSQSPRLSPNWDLVKALAVARASILTLEVLIAPWFAVAIILLEVMIPSSRSADTLPGPRRDQVVADATLEVSSVTVLLILDTARRHSQFESCFGKFIQPYI